MWIARGGELTATALAVSLLIFTYLSRGVVVKQVDVKKAIVETPAAIAAPVGNEENGRDGPNVERRSLLLAQA